MLFRMRVITRIAIVALVLGIPIGMLSWFYAEQVAADTRFSSKELEGSAAILPVWIAINAALLAEGAADAPAVRQAISDVEGRPFVDRLQALAVTDAQRVAFVEALRSGDIVRQTAAGGDLIRAISDGSNMTLDPDLDTFYLMDAIVFRIPLLASAAQQLHELGGRGVRRG